MRGSNGKSGLGSRPTRAVASRTTRAPRNGKGLRAAQSPPRTASAGLRAEEAGPSPGGEAHGDEQRKGRQKR